MGRGKSSGGKKGMARNYTCPNKSKGCVNDYAMEWALRNHIKVCNQRYARVERESGFK